ncbi:hypothetical protein SO694_00046287 [Aureococcus anophagefferens]|uniref:TFIIS N-terminal domain-containing protein n=1 Tax=Aureococcus anophagefferens TaxID=44056 RepID=A0ABR1G7H1_AURAN
MEDKSTEDAGGIEETDRVKLVELIKAADADAAYVRAVLRRLAALPVPSKAVMQLVAKDIARLKKKHADGAVRDLAGALMRKWIGHYGGTEPKPPTRAGAARPTLGGARQRAQRSARARERSDDERKALQALRSTGITTVMNVSRPGEASAPLRRCPSSSGAAAPAALRDRREARQGQDRGRGPRGPVPAASGACPGRARRVLDRQRAASSARPREFDFLAPAAASPKKGRGGGARRRALGVVSGGAPARSALALRLANRTTMADEAPLMEALDWGVEDADESGEPANPRHRLPDVEDGFKRVYCERALIKPSGVDAFVLDRNGGDDARGCLMPKIRILAEDEDEAFDEYICAVHDMYYDVPTDPAAAEDYDADLKIAFSYMYTHAMLAEEFASLGSAGLDKCAPPFDEARELAECNDVSYMTSSVDFVRGVVHVAWTPEECVHFFRTREVGDGKLSAPKSTPAIELAKRAKALFS